VANTRRSARSDSSRSSDPITPRRKFIVFVSLVGALTLTSALLLALAPESLRPDAAQKSLFATSEPQSFDVLFDTASPIKSGRWKYVFIHHSRTNAGDAVSLAQTPDGIPDHFVIGNGDGCQDGEIQITQRWTQQDIPGNIPGLPRTQPNFISICLVGDFDTMRPTASQRQRLAALVSALQRKLDIPAENVVLTSGGVGIAGIGRNFPLKAFRTQLNP
jgi:N-acetylmuramoyl-L-alanine amidase